MTGVTASFVLQTLILATGAQPYPEAYKTTEESGRPLLVLVGADWCPACEVMKKQTLAKLEKEGKLKQLSFSIVNADKEPAISRQVMRGSSIPQLILFEKTASGWKRSQITGGASQGDVEAFISRAVEQFARLEKQKAANPKPTASSGGGE